MKGGNAVKKKIGTLSFIVIVIALTIFSIATILLEDKLGPIITFTNQDFEYYGDKSTIVEDVRAVDKQDGDVTDSILVESIQVLSSGDKVNILYVAKDSNNNVTKENRIVTYNKEGSAPDKAEDDTNKDIMPNESVDTKDDADKEIDNKNSDEDDKDLENPVIKLKTYSVTIPVDGYFNPMNYIEEATDDKDDAWRHIHIVGNYDRQTPGTYPIEYSIIDSDGNMSNKEVLELVIE
jgi:hypothetical protein